MRPRPGRLLFHHRCPVAPAAPSGPRALCVGTLPLRTRGRSPRLSCRCAAPSFGRGLQSSSLAVRREPGPHYFCQPPCSRPKRLPVSHEGQSPDAVFAYSVFSSLLFFGAFSEMDFTTEGSQHHRG